MRSTYPVLVPHRQKALDQDSVCPPSPASVAPLPERYSFHLHCRQVPLATTQKRGLWIHQPTHTDPHLNGHAVQSKLPRCRGLTKNKSLIKKNKILLEWDLQLLYRMSQKFVLYFISVYFSTIGLGKEIISTKVVSFNIISLFSYLLCHLLSRIFDLCMSAPEVRARDYIFQPHMFCIS